MKYCQGPKCHTYETRKRSEFYYLGGNACSMACERDWYNKFGNLALDHFGRIHEPKRVGCDGAWYKDYTWGRDGNHQHYIHNDLLGRRISITQQQYNSCTTDNITDLVRP